ncbi:peptide chain release factor N(5)-glutamine methyltransferase [Alicyclobacillus dauci]|uniref:Release factor glutamine methyltransferase n=1 Tax=Alicyclobacillus dauci TaxID=1475485 RepID=A0ABY6ZAN7_9BACL|nr:peptide chain release factor N(5)-glutamine methyltransferase [Alicyclobacillus dauci]WAH39321.1 peptide chain release factor N(5)-glutamine methyltransferase [Alicyclobacillus dauci]
MSYGQTYGGLLTAMTQALAKADVYSSWPADEVQHQTRAEAEQMLAHVTGWSRLQLLQHFSDNVPGHILKQLQQYTEERAGGKPLAYILGHTDFYGRVFQTRPGCLIPRPDTETVADHTIRWITVHRPSAKVVDIGTGTGCIAITVALECPDAHVTAVDVADDAVQLANANARLLEATNVAVVQRDGFEWLHDAETFDKVNVIVSNPPYIPAGEKDLLEVSVKSYEPHLALFAGEDGLSFYRRFAKLTEEVFLEGPAALFLEVGMGQARDVVQLFRAEPQWADFSVQVYNDLRGVERVVALMR